MKIKPLAHGFGAEILDLDLSAPVDADTAAAIRKAFADHLILVIRGQEDLSAEDHVRFCELFGNLGKRSRPADDRHEGADAPAEVMFVSNRKEDGRFIGSLPEGEMQFHMDQCYVERPARATCLYAVVVPDEGGDTVFGDLCRAYETLPGDLKALVDEHNALNVFTYDSTSREEVAEVGGKREFVQPMVVVHPETARRALYVNRLMTTRITGLDPEKSQSTLARLIEHEEQPEFLYTHKWRKGDLLIWDNLCTIHARTDFDPAKERHLRRFTVEGGPLVAA